MKRILTLILAFIILSFVSNAQDKVNDNKRVTTREQQTLPFTDNFNEPYVEDDLGGWSVESINSQIGGWAMVTFNMAQGDSTGVNDHEVNFTDYSIAIVGGGISYFISPKFDLSGVSGSLILKYKNYVENDPTLSMNKRIGVVTRIDNEEWSVPVYEINLTEKPQNDITIIIDNEYVGEPNFQFAFFYERTSYTPGGSIGWYIDDVVLESGPYQVDGKVTDIKDNPIKDAQVMLDDNHSVYTDNNGEFSFNVHAGEYTLTISKDGYEDHSQEITIVGDIDLDTITLSEIYVEPYGLIIVSDYKNPTKAELRWKHESLNTKGFSVFKIFLDNEEVAEVISDTSCYVFLGLIPNTIYTAGVQSVYTSGASDIIEYEFKTHVNIIDNSASIVGIVTNGTNPLGGVNVKIDGNVYSTNSKGYYSIPNIISGTYNIEFSKNGYVTYTIYNEVIVQGVNYIDIVILEDEGTKVQIDALSKINVYPNPFIDKITISDPELIKRVIVSNILGQRVMDVNLNGQKEIPVNRISSGTYVITLIGFNGETTSKKLLKR